MRRPPLSLLLPALLLAAALGLALFPRPEPGFLLGGIQVNEPDLGHWLDALEASGMNAVSVTDYAHQGDWDSWNLWWDEEEDEGIVREIRAAEERGLEVVLILRVALDHAFERNAFLWHGMIQPRSEADLDEWFDRYTRFATGWAERAEREGVDLLMVASELNALTSTVPVAEIPPLPAYYLDRAKEAERVAELLAFEEALEARHLALPQRDGFPSLAGYLDARTAAERDWAARVTYAGEGARIARLNARRALLERKWRAVIERVREVYSGPVGYAANFDRYREVGFWDHLDVLGVNAYFEIRDRLVVRGDRGALYAELQEGWREVLSGIDGFLAAEGLAGMPVVFTEIGYTDRANSTLRPWAGEGFSILEEGEAKQGDGKAGGKELFVWSEEPRDPMERALAVRALREVHEEMGGELLDGLLYWKLSTQERFRRMEPFVLLVGPWSDDPLLDELRAFVEPGR